ncbi:MAG TPA: thiolase family protein, partial [Candidatus Binatia bacterium]|nr:thiolase family protein [Candidatus Binatia bacterium]
YERVVHAFLDEWRIDPSVVDGLLVAPAGMAMGTGAELFVHENLGDSLGLHPIYSETLNAGGATYAVMAARAALAIEGGRANAVLCAAAGKFPKVGAGGAAAMARMVSHPDFEFIYGTFIPALYALAARRHMHDRSTTREALAAVAVSSREWALRHPNAIMRSQGRLTIDDVLRSRPIAEPFHMLDCSVPCEGGAAFLVARGDVARAIASQPAYIRGFGEYHDHGPISQSRDFATMGAGEAARQAYGSAGLEPRDVRVAEIYDAFTINPIMFLEETGLAAAGSGGRFFLDGRGAPGGSLPINTYGGLLSFGHTGDASGMSMIVEGALQTMGLCGDRQVPDADVVLVHTYGGMMAEHCTLILGRTP